MKWNGMELERQRSLSALLADLLRLRALVLRKRKNTLAFEVGSNGRTCYSFLSCFSFNGLYFLLVTRRHLNYCVRKTSVRSIWYLIHSAITNCSKRCTSAKRSPFQVEISSSNRYTQLAPLLIQYWPRLTRAISAPPISKSIATFVKKTSPSTYG